MVHKIDPSVTPSRVATMSFARMTKPDEPLQHTGGTNDRGGAAMSAPVTVERLAGAIEGVDWLK